MKLSVQCRSRERCRALCSRGSTSPLSWSSPNPLAEHRAEIWDKLAGSFNDSFARKRYSEAPFFYKYLPLPLSLFLSVMLVDWALSQGWGLTQKLPVRAAKDGAPIRDPQRCYGKVIWSLVHLTPIPILRCWSILPTVPYASQKRSQNTRNG